MQKRKNNLSITHLRLWLHLGCSEEEKFLPQPVAIDIEVEFSKCPEGAFSDRPDEVICYASLG